jgi:peptidoglycan/LPS O-acetylase OafA/YrhL
VADHVFAAPRGGFVGVDVFFVISGYLITDLLLREYARSGTISFAGFTRRRVRRIMPAAALVLVVTAVGTWAVLGAARWETVRWDALAAAALVANWRFAAVGTDYFQADGPTSPLQHFWSLSVEEQFYLVWPWLLLACLTIAARRARAAGRPAGTGRAPAGVAVGVVGAASLAWAAVESVASPTTAYFSTRVRAWELLIGAAVAVAGPSLARRSPTALRHVTGWAGLGAIAVAVVVTDADRGFPVPGVLLPVLGAAAVLVAGAGDDRRRWVPLTDPVSGYVGDVSYSLYLWHFPVLGVLGPYLQFLLGAERPDLRWYLLVLAVTALLSVLGHHLVEVPVLRSRWLTSRAGGMRPPRTRLLWSAASVALTVGVLVTAVTVNGLQGAVSVRDTAAASAASRAPGADAADTATAGAQAALRREITAALRATSWPAHLTPTVADAAEETLPGNTWRCGSAAWLPAADCTFGDPAAPHRAVLVGDSIAQAYVPALAAILGTGDWSLRITSMYACPFIDRDVGRVAAQTAVCADRRAKEAQVVRETKPDLLVVANTMTRGTDRTTEQATTEEAWNEAFRSALADVAPSADHVVVLAPPPADKDIGRCYSNFAGPAACVSAVRNTEWLTMAADQTALVERFHGSFVDTRPWFCDRAGSCPPFVGDLLVKKDAAHPTAVYVEHLVPVMRAAFERLGVLGDAGAAAGQHAAGRTGG